MHGEVEFGGWSSASVAEFCAGEDLLRKLSRGGQWFVVADFEGRVRGWRFDSVQPSPLEQEQIPWIGPEPSDWTSSHSRDEYVSSVARTRDHIAEGDVYQANICRVLSAPLLTPAPARSLTSVLSSGNPAPHLGYIQVRSEDPEQSVWLASASPELFFDIAPHTKGATISSSPIKGTAKSRDGLTPKDEAENVMITDLVRNDLSPLCIPGTIGVRDFLAVEQHPGLVHLVSTVEGEIDSATLNSDDFWVRAFEALFQPGSVSGAPKSSALRIINELETHPRGPYCGGFGWIDGDSGRATLAVGIRSFWWDENCSACAGPSLHFGTGAGITWGSDPEKEWLETELKASRLVALASGKDPS